jgi:hypothetical protein
MPAVSSAMSTSPEFDGWNAHDVERQCLGSAEVIDRGDLHRVGNVSRPPPGVWLLLMRSGSMKLKLHFHRSQACATAVDFACSATTISAVPPNIMLIPTSRPIAQAAVPGKPAMMSTAIARSIRPLASNQPH